MDFDRLDKILRERHISRRKLALAVGIGEGTMSTAFMRRSGLSSADVLKIAEYLGVSPYWLDGRDSEPGKPQIWPSDPKKLDIRIAGRAVDIPEDISRGRFYAFMSDIYGALARLYEDDAPGGRKS